MNPRALVKAIFHAGLERVDPRRMILSVLRVENGTLIVDTGDFRCVYNLSAYKRIMVTGAGKAGAKMALGLEELLGSLIHSGVVAVKHGHTEKLSRIGLIEAGHPVPDVNSLEAARAVMDMCASAGEGDLVINLISGGGSSILTAPYEDENFRLSLDDLKTVTGLLLGCGASIHEVNCVRKHLSLIKGGRLARILAPADSLSFVLSDVIGDNLDVIASGLTVPDATGYADAAGIFERYGLGDRLPRSVRDLIAAGVKGGIPDTPKPGDDAFRNCRTILLGSNRLALAASGKKARDLGLSTLVLGSRICGEAREVAKVYAGIAMEAASGNLGTVPVCILGGGETTVTVLGRGKGGRNQEMAVSFLGAFTGNEQLLERVCFLSAGTDGNDGPTDAAGGFADMDTLKEARAGSLDIQAFIEESDSYHFLQETGSLFITGPTNTNVCDLQFILVFPA